MLLIIMDADITLLKSVCKQLNDQKYVSSKPSLKSVPVTKENNTDNNKDDENEEIPSFNRADLENLVNFIDIYTDVLEHKEVIKQFRESNFTNLPEFETINGLHNVGFFYVKVNEKCSPIEFLSLLDKIPLEQFCLPGTEQVPYPILNHLFAEFNDKTAIKLMVLGHSFGYFELINPYMKMKHTLSDTKLLLSAMGNLSILIKRGYLRECIQFIQNFDILNQKQKQSGQEFLS